MVTSIWESDGMGGGETKPQLTAYNYDQLNRIKHMHAYRDITSNVWGATGPSNPQAYENSYKYDSNGNIDTLMRYDKDGNLFDQLYYQYDIDHPGGHRKRSNKLYSVLDPQGIALPPGPIKDVGDMGAMVEYDPSNTADFKNNNFYYDEIGNLVQDKVSDIVDIKWNVSGKMTEIIRGSTKSDLAFEYDGFGNRTAKIEKPKSGGVVVSSSDWYYTYYIRDAKGNPMSIFEKNTPSISGTFGNSLVLTEVPLYGSSRVGVYEPETDMTPPVGPVLINPIFGSRFLLQKKYELSNHLGNVLTTVSDRKLIGTSTAFEAEILSAQDYYPFGMIMPGRSSNTDDYRFGFNGKENDSEVNGEGNIYDYGFRIYNSRLGKFLSVDPLKNSYPWNSPYSFAENDVIRAIDLDGLERLVKIYDIKGNMIGLSDTYSIEEGAHGNKGYGTLIIKEGAKNSSIIYYEENGKIIGVGVSKYSPFSTFGKFMSLTRKEVEDSRVSLMSIEFLRTQVETRIAANPGILAAERYVLRRNPYDASKITDIGEPLIQMSRDVSGILGIADPHNNISDAMRHALLNAVIADKANIEFAKDLTDAHEEDRVQDLGEKIMDLFNNSKGRDIYQNSNGDLQAAWNSIVDEAAKGGLLVYNSETKTTSKSTLTPEQVEALKNINVSDYVK